MDRSGRSKSNGYGKVLVYQLSESLTAIAYSDANENKGTIISPKVDAIVVFDVNTTSYRVTNNGGCDANNPTAILCGKMQARVMWTKNQRGRLIKTVEYPTWFKTIGGADPNSTVAIYGPL